MKVKLYTRPLSAHGDFLCWTDQQTFCRLMKKRKSRSRQLLRKCLLTYFIGDCLLVGVGSYDVNVVRSPNI